MEILFGKPLWYFYSTFGKGYIEECIKEGLSEEQICFFNGRNLFHIVEREKHIYLSSMSTEGNNWLFPDAKPISNYEVYKKFGIEAMEEAREKQYSRI